MNPLDVLLSLGHEVVDLVGARLAPLVAGVGGSGSSGSSGPVHPPAALAGELAEAYAARTGHAAPAGCKRDPWGTAQLPDGSFEVGIWIPVSAPFTPAPV